MALSYNSRGIATQMPSQGIGVTGYQNSMGAGPGTGSGYLGTMGMSPEYNDQLFMNIQQNINKNKDASRQNVLDNSSRFGQGGGQEQALLGVNQGAADQSVSARSGAEMQGAMMGREDRNKANDRFFTAEQNQQNRLLQHSLQDNMLGQDAWQYTTNRNDAQQAQLMKMFSSMFGMGAGGQ